MWLRRGHLPPCNFWVESAQRGLPHKSGKYNFCDFFVILFFSFDPAPRSNRRTYCYAEWLKWRVSAQGRSFWGSGRWVTSYGENVPQKWAWIGSFKPKRQNLYIALSPELLIQRTSDLRSEFRPWKALRGWSAITPKQIQHGWWLPSWKWI